MPCPHYDIKIVQRSSGQSAVAAAAYQSGERLFSEYDQRQKYYSHKSGIVHKEIMLPSHAPSEYADRNTLWNSVEAAEKQWNAQLARRIILAIPRELPQEQYADLLRDYCREFFFSKGMAADLAIHDKGDGNPHAHILLTMRAVDETGRWLPKSRKVYDLDKNGERIKLASGRWKSHKENTVDWNDRGKAEVWRQGWSDTANRYLEAAGRAERLDLRSYKRQGIDKVPTVHLGAAMSHMEKKGIRTGSGQLNREIQDANRFLPSIHQSVYGLKKWVVDLRKQKAALTDVSGQKAVPTLPELLARYLALQQGERIGRAAKGQPKGSGNDFSRVQKAIRFLQDKDIPTVERLDAYLDVVSDKVVAHHAYQREKEKRIKAVGTILSHMAVYKENKAVYQEYAAINWKKKKEKFAEEHADELGAYLAARQFFKEHEAELPYDWQGLLAERERLAAEQDAGRKELVAVQSELKILQDVRGWVNHVLPPDERRAVAEPGKKASIRQDLRWKSEGVAQREEQRRSQPRQQQRKDMEH